MQFLGKIGQIIDWRPSYGFGTPSGKYWIRHCMLYIEKYNKWHRIIWIWWILGKFNVGLVIIFYHICWLPKEQNAERNLWRIQDSSHGDANRRAPTYYLATFFPKTAWTPLATFIYWKGTTRRYSESEMVLGDRDLLLILALFTIVMYGESRGNWAKNPVAKYYLNVWMDNLNH